MMMTLICLPSQGNLLRQTSRQWGESTGITGSQFEVKLNNCTVMKSKK